MDGTGPGSPGAPDISALVKRSQEGDREAFTVLVLTYQDVVYNMAHQRLGDADAALDAAQETFVKAFSGLGTFRGESTFKSWLCSIALREAENQRRRRTRQLRAVALKDADPAGSSPEPGASIESEDEVAQVRRAIEAADEDDARLILMRDVENLSYGEIAGALGVPVGTIKSGLSRARARLRTALEKPAARPAGVRVADAATEAGAERRPVAGQVRTP